MAGDSVDPRRPHCAPTPDHRLGGLLAGLLLISAQLSVALASPASLREMLARFETTEEGRAVPCGVVFLPLDAMGSAPTRASDAVRHGADRELVPASLAKIPTSALALELLGPGFTFRTGVLVAGAITGDTLRGDLIIRGGGDPFLVSERLWLLAREIRLAGVAEVTGDLVIDTGWLAPDTLDPTRTLGREISDRPYAARLSALPVNFNSAGFRLRPAARPGPTATAEINPRPDGYLRLESTLQTGPAGRGEEWTLELTPLPDGELARVHGRVPAGGAAPIEYRSVRDPDRFAAAMLRSFLAEAGIRIRGRDRVAPAPVEAKSLLEFPSPPLRELVGSAQRYSNNLMADQIAMALAAKVIEPDTIEAKLERSGRANLTSGAALITSYLHHAGGAGPGVRQLDGSGLHPGSRISADALARVLARAWGRFDSAPEFAASLAVPGEDGTLRRRFEGVPIRLRGKTGTMSTPPSSGLAGYLEDRGRPVAFVILMNPNSGAKWDHARLRDLQESWVREYLR